MLDKKVFLKGLNYLKAMYINWQFSLTNKMLLEIWYDTFKDYEDSVFTETIKEYCKTKQFPPNSPYDILNCVENFADPNSAWETILDVINRSLNNSMFLNLMFKEQPKLYEFVKGWNIDTVAKDKGGNKCYGYILGKEFKRAYQNFLDSKNVVKINGLILKPSNNLQLENKNSNLSIEGGYIEC